MTAARTYQIAEMISEMKTIVGMKTSFLTCHMITARDLTTWDVALWTILDLTGYVCLRCAFILVMSRLLGSFLFGIMAGNAGVPNHITSDACESAALDTNNVIVVIGIALLT